MNFKPEDLLARLDELETTVGGPVPGRYIIAFSGGLDSSVLLYSLAKTRQQHGKPLLAVHVDHRLQPDSAEWAKHCERVASELGVDFVSDAVTVDHDVGLGPEAAARDARYTTLRRHIGAGDWLLSAHHRDDQAETLLINLMRGSGPAGIAGIPAIRKFADGWLVRPLLGVSRNALAQYASEHGLEWIDDPSNDESRYDRNFLRNEVLPLLERRWPEASSRLDKSASFAREAAELLAEFADADLASIGTTVDRLDGAALRALTPTRQKNVLRRAISRAGLPPVSSRRLQSIIDELLPARDDAAPLVCWDGAEVRRFRDRLYLLTATPAPEFDGRRLGADPVSLGAGLGRLLLEQGNGPGLSEDCVSAGLTLKLRAGGEELKPLGQTHTRKLKKLLQEDSIVPWMRDRLPLVYCGERLVAVADIWLASEVAVSGGAHVRWQDRPALH